MRPRRKDPHQEKQLSYRTERRERAWYQEVGLRLWRRRRKTTRSRAARRVEHQQLSKGGLTTEDAETIALDATRKRYKRMKEKPETLGDAIESNNGRRLQRANRKNPEARAEEHSGRPDAMLRTRRLKPAGQAHLASVKSGQPQTLAPRCHGSCVLVRTERALRVSCRAEGCRSVQTHFLSNPFLLCRRRVRPVRWLLDRAASGRGRP